MDNVLFCVIIGLIIIDYIVETVLSELNTASWLPEIPEEGKGIYSEEAYQKSRSYHLENHKISRISSVISLVGILLMFFLEGFAWIDNLAISINPNPVPRGLLFFFFVGLLSAAISLPFSIYNTFVIEEKYGFNKTTPATFILDLLKGALVSGILGGGIISLLILTDQYFHNVFWLIAWAILSSVMILGAMFYTTLILQMFNKLTPLSAGELRSAIEKYSAKEGFDLKNIFIMDGSKRSSKANAFFSGMGSKKTIVLYDTLIQKHSTEELVAILAHEIGHYKLKHTTISLIIGILQTGIMLGIFSFLSSYPLLPEALNTKPGFHISILVFGILFSPVSAILGIFMNMLSRKNEYEADAFAAQTYNAEYLFSALKKLSVDSLSNLTPHPAYVFVHYSHPPLLNRLKALNKYK